MKQLSVIFLILLSSSITFAQTLTYEEISSWEKNQKIDFTEYVASNGQSYKVGDILKLGKASSQNDRYFFVVQKSMGKEYTVASDQNGTESEILKLKIFGTKRSGFYVVLQCKAPIAKYEVTIDKALQSGEIESTVMSRSEAIAKLKEAKDLLDLDMMTSDEYEALKKELEPIIRN